MSLVIIIVILLLILPLFPIITDIKSGKIKNYFIFPLLFISFLLTFFISGFYSSDNIIGLIIVILFGYLFYINNKWGAGDGKYIIFVGINSIIISYLLGFDVNIINYLFISVFGLLLLYITGYLLLNIKNIKNINLKFDRKVNFLDDFYVIFFVYTFSFLINRYILEGYTYIIIFLSIILLIPILEKLKIIVFKFFIIFFGLFICFFFSDYVSITLISLVFFIFGFLQFYFDKIFDIIDVKKILLLDIKQGNILTGKSINKIKKETKLDFLEMPLQGDEVFNLIGKYKKINKNPEIYIYNELKIGIIIYAGYFLSIIINIQKIL